MRLDVKVSIPFPILQRKCFLSMERTNVHVNLQRQLLARSERVKGIDFHPTEPWVRTSKPTCYVILPADFELDIDYVVQRCVSRSFFG